ncbi:phospholipase D-like domain-containing protein [Cellvibrio polysaccharolyticus]|uniref:phospholipase D n=1 Tax=Cellvibrio polysaccharolyticus TaxID=2082724 RepID=A0A928YT38_9GAMM|nr:phospholipase D-like domain-containing protein [Cellvibrio polysaccharolyticus]MBE8715890.1 hypothetical protein [Cellvibrio polysaccharolyticus]
MENSVFFENIEDEIIRLLRSAKESVKICVAWINGEIYRPILNDLAHRGILIDLIYDNNSTNKKYGITSSSLFNVYAIDTRISSSLMHNKFCIIDDRIVINGSYNWSSKAKNSFENIVVTKDDFKLVKAFLHEFYDLIGYFYSFNNVSSLRKCNCGSYIYNLGVLGQEWGSYDESKIDIWSVCVRNNHAIHLGEEYEQYLHTYLGIKYEPDLDADHYDREVMISAFQSERQRLINLEQYFNQRAGRKIDAIATVEIINWNEHMEWNEDPEYAVNIFWCDMLFRKIIPRTLYDDAYGSINQIIKDHT